MLSIDNKSMKKLLFTKAVTSVVALLMLQTVISCVDNKYELSEDNIDTTVAVFQEGISIPLGSTAPITLGSLVDQLDDETKEFIKSADGAYMFHMADTYDLTEDLTEALSAMDGLESIVFDNTFSFNLSDVDLSALEIAARTIGPEVIEISEMLDVPDLDAYLPHVDQKMSVSAKMPAISSDNLDLDLSGIENNMTQETVIASMADEFHISDVIASLPISGKELDYEALCTQLKNTYGVQLPAMQESYKFENYTLEIPVEISLPEQIGKVKSINLDDGASFELTFEIINSLFTGGTITPVLDVDLHEIFRIDTILSGMEDGAHLEGEGLNQHVMDKFVLSAKNNWKVSHKYHVDSLMINHNDWKVKNGNLVLDKKFHITVGGELEEKNLVTTLKHLHDCGNDPMKIRLAVKFHNLKIEDVIMEVNPISLEKNLEIPLEISPVSVPSLVSDIDYVDFNDDAPLSLNMTAMIPDAFKSMDISLKTLKVEFPAGVVVNRPAGSLGIYDSSTRILKYENISLSEGFDDNVVIDRMNLPSLVGGQLSYSGKVKVYAEAQASGLLNSKNLIQNSDSNIDMEVSVDYAPELSDYSITINDYEYPIEIDPVVIKEELEPEVGEYLKDSPVHITLQEDVPGENQKLVIFLDYPQHSAINLRPLPGEGLKFDFPDMLVFAQKSVNTYNVNTVDNSIHFTGNAEIPREIVLEIESINVSVENPEGTDTYFVKDEFTVTGGVCLAGTTISKSDVDQLRDMNAKVEFGASIPRLSPAELGVDDYRVTIDETVEIDEVEVEVPEMINTINITDVILKDVYLDFKVDASSIAEIAGGAELTMSLDICFPSELLVDGAEDNVLHIHETLSDDFKFELDPIHILGFDFSDIKVVDGKLTMGAKEVSVSGYVELKNLKLDTGAMEDKDLKVSISGSLSSRNEDGSPSESIAIDKINAHVGLDIDPVNTTVDLSSLSEGLDAEGMDISIDINRYWLSLDVNTNIDIPVSGTINIVPWYAGKAGEGLSSKIEMDPAKRVDDMFRFYISNKEPSDPSVEFIDFDIISLLYNKEEGQKATVADSLQISFTAGVDPDKTCTLEPSKDYKFKLDYEMGVPFELGEDFKIEYHTVIENLDIPVELFEYGSIGLIGEVTNSLPLSVGLQVRPLDSDGEIIPLKEDVGVLRIASCNSKGEPVTSDLRFVLSGKGSDLTDMTSVELIFSIDSKDAAGVPFREDSFIELQLNALIPDGVTLDLKDFISEKEEE